MTTVSVGMPTYNRPEFLAQAIESILNQTYGDLQLLISDNASPNPDVRTICERYAARDPRVKYVRQETNIGAAGNFVFVYEQVASPYFMWASDDDLWEPEFIERGVKALQADPTKSIWMCQFDRINDAGQVIEKARTSTAHASRGRKRFEVARFLLEVRYNAIKVMLVYAVFRRAALAESLKISLRCREMKSADSVFVYALICRNDLIVDRDCLFHKRRHDQEPLSKVRRQQGVLNSRHFSGYSQAAAGTPYATMTNLLLPVRYCIHIYENLRRSVRKRLGLKKSLVATTSGPR